MPKNERFIQKLREQLGFIARSCNAFDRGHEDEAIRLATTIRVLLHDTPRSVSLLKHMGLQKTSMLSSSRGYGDWRDYLAHQLDLRSPEPVRVMPVLGERFNELAFTEWWSNQPVFSHDGDDYPRRKIVLSAANKDGGAHVDAQLEEYYEVLCAGRYLFGFTGHLEYDGSPPFPQGVTIYPKNPHFALIRQFAHEVIASATHYRWTMACPV